MRALAVASMPRLELQSAAFFLLAVAYLMAREERVESTELPAPVAPAARVEPALDPAAPTLAALATEPNLAPREP